MEDKKTKKTAFTFTNDFKNWKKEFEAEFEFQKTVKLMFNNAKINIVNLTKKVLKMKVVKAVSAYVDKHSTMAIITLWIMAIMIMASMLTGNIVTGIVYTIYLAIYTIMYFLLYHLLVIFAGLAVIGVSKLVTVFKKDK